MQLSDLKPAELEIIEPSTTTKKYGCGHEGAATFKLRMGDWNLTSPVISQDEKCAQCCIEWTCSNLHRCPECGRVYEVVPGSNSVALSSFRHFAECFPQNAVKMVHVR